MKSILRIVVPALAGLILSSATAQTVGQYELRKRTNTGFTSYGITLSNGQVIGLTADVPAAITPLLPANNLSDLANAATARSNLGLVIGTNVQAYNASLAAIAAGTWTGANSITTLGTISTGTWQAGEVEARSGGTTRAMLDIEASAGRLFLSAPNQSYGAFLSATNLTSNRSYELPDVAGTLITTGDTGTVTNSMLAGSIDLTTKVTGTLPVGNGGTGAATLTANNVILGNGTSAVQFVAPGTSGNVLTSNGTTWVSSAPAGGGLTIGTTTITSGTSGRVLYNNAGIVGEMTTSGSGTQIALTNSPSFTTPALGVPSSGTLTNCTGLPAASLLAGSIGTGNFTVTGTIFSTIGYNSNAYSSSVDYAQAGFWISSNLSGRGYWMGNNQRITSLAAAKTMLVGGTTTTAQGWHVVNTYSSDTSYETLVMDWSSNVGRVGTQKGSGGGSAREWTLVYDSTEKARVSSSGLSIGASGSAIAASLTTTTTWDPANLADGASETKAGITLTGVVVGDVVKAALTTLTSASWDVQATVVSENTVDVRITNRTGGAVDLSSGTLRVNCIKF